MLLKSKKPYVIYMAEIIYSYVSIKKKIFNIEQKKLLINLWKQEFKKLSMVHFMMNGLQN